VLAVKIVSTLISFDFYYIYSVGFSSFILLSNYGMYKLSSIVFNKMIIDSFGEYIEK